MEGHDAARDLSYSCVPRMHRPGAKKLSQLLWIRQVRGIALTLLSVGGHYLMPLMTTPLDSILCCLTFVTHVYEKSTRAPGAACPAAH